MEILKNKKKITLATVKAFASRNKNNIYTKTTSRFDGMTDMVENVEHEFKKAEIKEKTDYCKTGIQGIFTVGNSRDYFDIYEDNKYFGLEIYNCCGTTILAIKKLEVKP